MKVPRIQIIGTSCVVVGVTCLVVAYLYSTPASISPLYNAYIQSSDTQKKQTVQINQQELLKKLEEQINNNIPPTKKWLFGYYIIDLTTQQSFGKNETELFDAASIGKIAILTTLYSEIDTGAINETEKITITTSDIQDYGTGTIRYQKPPIIYTVGELAELMIKNSDNTAAFVLANKVGREKIEQYIKNIGLTNTDTKENTITPQDAAHLLQHIYTLKDIRPQRAGSILKIMTNSEFENRLPKLLPTSTIIAHKIGTGTAQIHDAGIILLEQRPYIFAIFSKNISDETKAEEIIAQLSKTVFEEMNEQNQ